jgi:uncharacterized protein (DUF2062 family)
MIRKIFKKSSSRSNKLDAFLEKYNLPKAYMAVNRRMITRGVAVGLFWGFIPMPMQMLAVMATTPLIRFNVPIAISMVWLSNPITMPPMYYMEYLTGNFLLGREGLDNIELTMAWFTEHFDDILVPLYVGTAFYSTVVTGIIYLALNKLWMNSVHIEKEERKRRKIKKKSKKNHNTHEV